jgi:transposase-like protein
VGSVTPRKWNTDGHGAYPPAIVRLKTEGALDEDCRHLPVPYLNNVLEQDHRAIKRRVNASQHFRSFWGAWRTIAGYEAAEMGANPDQLIHGDARGADHPAPPVINTGKQAGYPRISLPAAFSF